MLEGIAKELEQHVGKVLSFYLKDCPDLHRKAIRVTSVNENVVNGFLQDRLIVDANFKGERERVKGTNSFGIPKEYEVSCDDTTDGRKVTLLHQIIMAWSPAEPREASSEKMPEYHWCHPTQLNQYE